ncbi:(2Fe-2S)-binding protein [Roseobacter litoralis]|uniref:(2Fe-2S)-binding protein n=1 Tax=Roseobacter litoralis TaxID=42443 RepID=UPI00249562EC|nr:(2Fe-2S)-binding protein [Roseobacter litoralis]
MNIASRFQTLPEAGASVQFTLDGETVTARAGTPLAAALLAHSGEASRHTASGAGRTAFCMMGVCFDCLVEVDGTPNTQACMVSVRDGMVVKRQTGLRPLGGDDDVRI